MQTPSAYWLSRPITTPPTIVPGTESSPPRITTGNTINPKFARFWLTSVMSARSTPPSSALTAASAQASAKIRRTEMPCDQRGLLVVGDGPHRDAVPGPAEEQR